MSDQPGLKTMLEILMMLSGINRYTVKEIAGRFNVSDRTIYRYIETFRVIGFKVSSSDNRYFIEKRQTRFKDISDLIHFTKEEALILSKAIHIITDENKYKSDLVEKLYYLFDKESIANQLITPEHSENALLIKKAMEEKKQTIFENYASSNSKSIKNRLVEPFEFTSLYDSVWAFDLEDKTCKTFKIARIGRVTISANGHVFGEHHNKKDIDAFRFSGDTKIPVSFTMTQLAYNLITEEYPLSLQYITEHEEKYLFNGWVCDFKGISRFILGLIDDITEIQPHELKMCLNEKISGRLFN